MKKGFRRSLIVAALAALPMGSALADGDVSGTIGVKAWHHSMSKWYPTYDGTQPVIIEAESNSRVAGILSASVRYKDFMVGGSYFAKTNYSFSPFRDTIERKEYDLIAGYYVLPTLAVIAGYKEVDQDLNLGGIPDRQSWKYKGPIVGFSASAPLTGGFSLYGTAALGWLKFKPTGSLSDNLAVAFGNPALSGSIVSNSDADYRLGEVGIAYAFAPGSVGGIKSLIATVGYRNQSIIAKQKGSVTAGGVPVPGFDWNGLKGRDVTEGLTVGLVAAF